MKIYLLLLLLLSSCCSLHQTSIPVQPVKIERRKIFECFDDMLQDYGGLKTIPMDQDVYSYLRAALNVKMSEEESISGSSGPFDYDQETNITIDGLKCNFKEYGSIISRRQLVENENPPLQRYVREIIVEIEGEVREYDFTSFAKPEYDNSK